MVRQLSLLMGLALCWMVLGCAANARAPLSVHKAIEAGSMEELRAALAAGHPIGPRHDRYRPRPHALLMAVRGRHHQMVRLLLQHGARTDVRSMESYTPLHIAARYGMTDIVAQLLVAGADTEARDNMQRTPLHRAVEQRSHRTVAQLLAAGAAADARDRAGRTPLWVALQARALREARLLIRHGADVDTVDAKGSPLLVALIDTDKRDSAWLLLQRGADVNAQRDDGATALHVATRHGTLSAVELLLGAGASPDRQDGLGMVPLHIAVAGNHEALVRRLLSAGANVATQDNTGDQALHMVVGRTRLLDMLLAAGAKLEARGRGGETLLHRSASRHQPAFVRRLLALHANIEARDKQGMTPLFYAARYRHESAAVLLAAGADRTVRAADGSSVIHTAVQHDNHRFVKLFAGDRRLLGSLDNKGHTPLQKAAASGRVAVTKQLLALGVDVAPKDPAGRSALRLAFDAGHDAVVTMLLDAHADPRDLPGALRVVETKSRSAAPPATVSNAHRIEG